MKLFLQKNAKFSSVGGFAPRPPLASGDWGLCLQTPIANFWLRAWAEERKLQAEREAAAEEKRAEREAEERRVEAEKRKAAIELERLKLELEAKRLETENTFKALLRNFISKRITSSRGPSPRLYTWAIKLPSKQFRIGGEPLATLSLN